MLRLSFAQIRRAAVVGISVTFVGAIGCGAALADYDNPAYDEGMGRMSRRDFDGAILSFDRAIGSNTMNCKAYFKRGQCFYYLGSYQKALDDFSQAAQCDPKVSEFYLWRGTTFSKMGSDEHSILDYEEALRLDPTLLKPGVSTALPNQNEDARSRRNNSVDDRGRPGRGGRRRGNGGGNFNNMFVPERGRQAERQAARMRDDRNTLAVANYKAAVRIITNKIHASFVPGTVFGGIVRPEFAHDSQTPYLRPDGLDQIVANPKETITDCHHQIEANQQDAEAFFKRALALQSMGKLEKALEDFNEVISQQPNKIQYLLARAYCRHKANRDMSASEDIAKAQAIDPTLPRIIDFGDARAAQ
jgi:tetratricopeptide (TPR) repeat protein